MPDYIARLMDLLLIVLVYLDFAKKSEQGFVQGSDTLATDGLKKGGPRIKDTCFEDRLQIPLFGTIVYSSITQAVAVCANSFNMLISIPQTNE